MRDDPDTVRTVFGVQSGDRAQQQVAGTTRDASAPTPTGPTPTKPLALVLLTWGYGAGAVLWGGIALLAVAVAAFFGLGILLSEGAPPTGSVPVLVLVPLVLATVPPALLVFSVVKMRSTWKAQPESDRWLRWALLGLPAAVVPLLLPFLWMLR